ncbi:MAG: glycerophosphodiester phosphodiesterase [Pseudomonadota bacterium]
MDYPRWQLHRGYWKKGFRENTMEAFCEAKKVGCEMVELDVHLSRDGIPHIFHDFRLKKFFKINKRVEQMKTEDLAALNIQTLAEVIESDDVPQFLNIEIKSIAILGRKIIREVSRLIHSFQETEKCFLISSFNPMVLFWSHKLLPEIPTGLIIGDKKLLMDWKFKVSFWIANPDYLNVHFSLIDDEEAFERVQSCRRPLMVWTVNDHDKAEVYLTSCVDSVISDLPPISNL